eukprot:c18836_g1_i1 orf=137-1357(-)
MREEDDGSEMVARQKQVYAGAESMSSSIWDKLPNDLHDRVVARLPIHSIIRSKAVCHDWNQMVSSQSFNSLHQQVPSEDKLWLFMCSSFNCRENCCAYNPSLNMWHIIPLTFLPEYMRFPLIAVGGLLFIKGAVRELNRSTSCMAVCNPITRAWRVLPPMIRGRLNSLVGVFEDSITRSFKVVAAGGTSECGGDYECTTEVYDSTTNLWCVTGTVPREYTVKITVWTSKTVFCMGVLYCLTSARPYNIMAYDMKKGVWEEVKIPQPQELFCSFLIQRRGRLLLVGGARCEKAGQSVHIWELQNDGVMLGYNDSVTQCWVEIARIPTHHYPRLCKGKAEIDLKCAGSGDLLYFFKDSHSEMLLCDLSKSPTTWSWLPNCPLSAQFLKFSVKGLLVEPRLDGVMFGQA